MKKPIKLALAAALAASALTVPAHASACTGSGDPLPTTGLGLPSGLYALPSAPTDTVVVMAHGYRNSSESWRVHLESAAKVHGVIGVAMDYTGLGASPDFRGWPVAAGAADLKAAANYFFDNCPGIATVAILGVSMGGNMSGLAVAEMGTRTGGAPLFDFWIDAEGVSNVTETYAEASLVGLSDPEGFAQGAADDIAAEMGGTPAEVPQEYAGRTIAARAADIAATGIKGVVLIHGFDDGLVPYNQSRELATALRAAGVNVDFVNCARPAADETDPPGHEQTTLSDNLSSVVAGYKSPLVGHGWEGNPDHPVIKNAFARLWMSVGGAAIGPYREFVADDGSTTP